MNSIMLFVAIVIGIAIADLAKRYAPLWVQIIFLIVAMLIVFLPVISHE